jgi:hypothetical protein
VSTTDLSLAYVQRSWVKDYVAPTADVTADDEELLIQLV